MYYIERLRGQEIPAELREDWNRLAGEIPFRRWEWLATWWKHYQEGSELFILIARDASGLIRGIAPWRMRRSVASGRTIEPLGGGKVSSDYVSLLCAESEADLVACAFADWMLEANKSASAQHNDSWDLLLLSGIVQGDAAITKLGDRLRGGGCSTHSKEGLRTWRIPLLGDWDQYLASLSKPVRRQARRAMKSLQETDGIEYFESVDDASLRLGFSILIDLHEKRWDEQGIEGCFADERFGRFLQEACDDFFAQGRLHLSWLTQHGKPFVVNIEFSGGNVDYVYQGGLDPESRSLSPGWLHMVHLFQRAISLGTTHRDYLRGDEPYKKHWRGKPTQLVDLRMVPPHAAARLRHGVWMLGNSLKHWLKQRLRNGAPPAGAALRTDNSIDDAEATEKN